MGITPVGQGGAAAQLAAVAPKQTNQSGAVATSVSAPKKDVAIISERAKDLAALKAGKTASEEANESMTARAREASEAN